MLVISGKPLLFFVMETDGVVVLAPVGLGGLSALGILKDGAPALTAMKGKRFDMSPCYLGDNGYSVGG
jgi:hypothetical protein